MKKIPFYRVNKWYSLTINPENRYQYLGSEHRYRNFIRWLKAELREIFDTTGIPYVGNVELSEPKKLLESVGSRLHFHGMFKFTSSEQIFKFLLLGLNRMARIGQIDIDTVGDLPTWVEYCRKHLTVMPKDSILSNNYTVEDHYSNNTLQNYEAPEGLPQGRGLDGLAKEAQADVIVGSEASVATKPSGRKRQKPVSIKDWVNPLNAN